jgi:hypothetical protein
MQIDQMAQELETLKEQKGQADQLVQQRLAQIQQ